MNSSESRRIALAELLSAGGMELQLSGLDRGTVLAELVNCVKELANRPEAHQILLNALLDREELCSTGVGDGVALPHSRNALVGLVEQPVLVFGRHPRGIPFGAVDGKPARLFFLLVAPTVTQHLQILARLSRVLRKATIRRSLLKAQSSDEVISILRQAETSLASGT